MDAKLLKIAINGTGFAGNYTANVYTMIPHKNGVHLQLAGVTSGRQDNAERFAKQFGIPGVFTDHEAMLREVQPDIDNIACANCAHGQYAIESARAGVPVIVLEKPAVVWPGYTEGREADAGTRKKETMAYLAEVLDTVSKAGSKLLYAEDFVYFDGVKGLVQLLGNAVRDGKGKIILQHGVCAHQGSHAPAYDTPSKSGGGALFNKGCHPLGTVLYLKQVEGILRDGRPIRPVQVSGLAHQVMKHQPAQSGEHFRVMQNVDDFGRITVIFEDDTLAEVTGHDLSISGIRNAVSVIADFAEYQIRVNPNNENELFLPDGQSAAGIHLREKLPTAQGTSFPRPRQFYSHGYVGEMADAVECALEPGRQPQSGPLMAWDSMAALMAAYESSERGCALVDITEYTQERTFKPEKLPNPALAGRVFESA